MNFKKLIIAVFIWAYIMNVSMGKKGRIKGKRTRTVLKKINRKTSQMALRRSFGSRNQLFDKAPKTQQMMYSEFQDLDWSDFDAVDAFISTMSDDLKLNYEIEPNSKLSFEVEVLNRFRLSARRNFIGALNSLWSIMQPRTNSKNYLSYDPNFINSLGNFVTSLPTLKKCNNFKDEIEQALNIKMGRKDLFESVLRKSTEEIQEKTEIYNDTTFELEEAAKIIWTNQNLKDSQRTFDENSLKYCRNNDEINFLNLDTKRRKTKAIIENIKRLNLKLPENINKIKFWITNMKESNTNIQKTCEILGKMNTDAQGAQLSVNQEGGKITNFENLIDPLKQFAKSVQKVMRSKAGPFLLYFTKDEDLDKLKNELQILTDIN